MSEAQVGNEGYQTGGGMAVDRSEKRLTDRDQMVDEFIRITKQRSTEDGLTDKDVTLAIDVRQDLENELYRLQSGRPEGEDQVFLDRLLIELPRQGINHFRFLSEDRELAKLQRIASVNGATAMTPDRLKRRDELIGLQRSRN